MWYRGSIDWLKFSINFNIIIHRWDWKINGDVFYGVLLVSNKQNQQIDLKKSRGNLFVFACEWFFTVKRTISKRKIKRKRRFEIISFRLFFLIFPRVSKRDTSSGMKYCESKSAITIVCMCVSWKRWATSSPSTSSAEIENRRIWLYLF